MQVPVYSRLKESTVPVRKLGYIATVVGLLMCAALASISKAGKPLSEVVETDDIVLSIILLVSGVLMIIFGGKRNVPLNNKPRDDK